MKIAVRRERLCDQLRADQGAICLVQQASRRLARENKLRRSPDDRRIADRTEQESHQAGKQGTS